MSYLRGLISDFQEYRSRHPEESGVTDRFLALLSEWPHCLERSRLQGHLTASAFVVAAGGTPVPAGQTSPPTHVLLLHHRKLDIWIQPGGHADGDGDLARVARTELREETGLADGELAAFGIFDIDIHSIPARPGAPEHEHFDVRYLFRAPTAGPLVVSDESHDVRWVAIDDLENYTRERSILRMVGKLRLWSAGHR